MLSNNALTRLVASPSPVMSLVWLHEGKPFIQGSDPSLFVSGDFFI